MKSKTPIIAVILIAVALGAIFVVSRPNNESNKTDSSQKDKTAEVSETEEPNTVSIEDFAFKQDSIQIKKGTTITWVNKDEARHDISPTGGGSDFVASELLAKGEKYQFTFNTAGTYTYKCSPHPYMKGTIEVIE